MEGRDQLVNYVETSSECTIEDIIVYEAVVKHSLISLRLSTYNNNYKLRAAINRAGIKELQHAGPRIH